MDHLAYLLIGSLVIAGGSAWPRTFSPQELTFDSNNVCDRPYSCLNCSTSLICKPTPEGDWVEVATVQCKGSDLFCDSNTGSCVDYTPHNCGEKGQFVCLQDGIFPDPLDCNEYHICVNATSFSYICGAGESFDIVTQNCTKNAVCALPQCADLHGVKVPIHEGEFYAYCSNGSPLFVDKCSPDQRFNTSSQNCEFQCHLGKRTQDDCTDYHLCGSLSTDSYGDARKLYDISQKPCPSGSVIDVSLCLPNDQVQHLPQRPLTEDP